MRLSLLVLVAVITFIIVLLVNNPDLVNKFWLWVVGLAGVIVQVCKAIWQFLKNTFYKGEEMLKGKKSVPGREIKKS